VSGSSKNRKFVPDDFAITSQCAGGKEARLVVRVRPDHAGLVPKSANELARALSKGGLCTPKNANVGAFGDDRGVTEIELVICESLPQSTAIRIAREVLDRMSPRLTTHRPAASQANRPARRRQPAHPSPALSCGTTSGSRPQSSSLVADRSPRGKTQRKEYLLD
jgi:hypothetical protein